MQLNHPKLEIMNKLNTLDKLTLFIHVALIAVEVGFITLKIVTEIVSLLNN